MPPKISKLQLFLEFHFSQKSILQKLSFEHPPVLPLVDSKAVPVIFLPLSFILSPVFPAKKNQ